MKELYLCPLLKKIEFVGWFLGQGKIEGVMKTHLADCRNAQTDWAIVKTTNNSAINNSVHFIDGTILFKGKREFIANKLKRMIESDHPNVIVNCANYKCGDHETTTAGELGIASAGDYGTAISGLLGESISGENGTSIIDHMGIGQTGKNGKIIRVIDGKQYVGEEGKDIVANAKYVFDLMDRIFVVSDIFLFNHGLVYFAKRTDFLEFLIKNGNYHFINFTKNYDRLTVMLTNEDKNIFDNYLSSYKMSR